MRQHEGTIARTRPIRWIALVLASIVCTMSASGGEATLEDTLRERLRVTRALVAPFTPPSSLLSTTVVRFPDRDVALELRSRSIRSDHYRVLDASGNSLPRDARIRSFRGDAFVEGSQVAWRVAAISEGSRFRALLHADDGSVRGIQPLSDVVPDADPILHVFYCGEDILPIEGHCGVVIPGGKLKKIANKAPHWQPATAAATYEVAEIAFEGDVAYFASRGNSESVAEADILAITTGMASIYEAEVGITYEITSIVLQTDGSEQYSTNDPELILPNFRQYWNQNHDSIDRDTAHLMTGKDLQASTIGLAYVGVICDGGYGYGLSETTFTTNLVQRIALTSHEVGHNWNADHCDSHGDCSIMCSALGGCSGELQAFGNSEENQIEEFRDAVSCLEKSSTPSSVPYLDTFEDDALASDRWNTNKGAATTKSATGETSAKYSVDLSTDSSGSPDKLITYKTDFAAMTEAELAFYAANGGAEPEEDLIVEYKSAADEWVELMRVDSAGDVDATFTPYSVVLPPEAMLSEGKLRFRPDINKSKDHWYIDDFEIRAPGSTAAPGIDESSTSPVVFVAITGGGLPSDVDVPIINTSTLGISLSYSAAEVSDASFLTLTGTSGVVGAPPDEDLVKLSIASTYGVTSFDSTLVRISQTTLADDVLDVPVTLIEVPRNYFDPGSTLVGTIDSDSDVGEAWFFGITDESLEIALEVMSGDLKPSIVVSAQGGGWSEEVKFKNKSGVQEASIELPSVGLYSITVSGRDATTGGFSIVTDRTFTGEAAASSQKLTPETSGGTVSATTMLLPGATLNINVAARQEGYGPFTISILGPNSEELATKCYEHRLPDNGMLIRGVGAPSPGRSTITVSGFTDTESVSLTIEPVQPARGSATLSLD